jgi:hypothetical protein
MLGAVVGRSIKNAGRVAGALILLGGCQNVGPLAIDAGRDRYNSAIQSTAKVQTLANIIRVLNHDSTSFVDVTEVAATTTLTGTAGGTVSGIGSRPGTFGTLGTVTSGMTYSETPLIRYVPLTGQGLVSQMVRPLTADAIESLITSNWPTVAVLDLVALTITPDQESSFAALNIISYLANDWGVMPVAGKSELTSAQTPQQRAVPGGQDSSNGNRAPANDALIIFQRQSNAPAPPGSNPERAARLWRVLSSIYGGTQENSQNSIELRMAPVASARLKDRIKKGPIKTGAPLLKTYSGIGILKNATEQPGPKIRFVTRDQFDEITSSSWNKNAADLGFYTLLSYEEDKDDNPKYTKDKDYQKINREVEDWITKAPNGDLKDRLIVYEKTGLDVSNADFIRGNRRLGTLRRYVLIITDDVAPANAYVAYPYQGVWYYIDGKDKVSQNNFNLISLLLTMMSVPSTLPPITTSISAGGGG